MDIVDIIINTRKYISNNSKRHVCVGNNISYWIQLNINIIVSKHAKIIGKYLKFLNQQNTKIITKYIKYKINVVPILYKLNYNDIKLLIKKSFKYENVYMLRILHDYIIKLVNHD